MTPFDPRSDCRFGRRFDQGRSDPERDDLVRGRQRGRAVVMAVLLGALVVLIFAISIAKIQAGMAH